MGGGGGGVFITQTTLYSSHRVRARFGLQHACFQGWTFAPWQHLITGLAVLPRTPSLKMPLLIQNDDSDVESHRRYVEVKFTLSFLE